ncbi:hypothetical protein BGW39_000436 [Mortierella sp. 14UC]|nr:hypothetical protein BGW39_000436 [Mortierella sp. 14UC]
MLTQQEYVHKELEPTLHLGPRRGPPRNPRGESRSDHRLHELWHSGMLLGNTVAINKKRPSDFNEPAGSGTRSTRFQLQSIQDNSRGRPNKRRRDELPGNTHTASFPNDTRPASFAGYASTDRVLPSTPFRNPPLRFPASDSTAVAQSSNVNSGNPNNAPLPALLLLDADLWIQFHEHHNEMIITKSGRCLFPCLRFRAVNLDPEAYYSIRLNFDMPTPNRFRFHNGLWKPVEPLKNADDGQSSGDIDSQDSADPTGNNSNMLRESYTHPDRFQLGSHWMANPISFAKVKLTNKVESQSSVLKRATKHNLDMGEFDSSYGGRGIEGANSINTNLFHMTSFHQYCPRLCLMERRKDSNAILASTTYRFNRTKFMAVTHYQNYKVNDLKKSHNPHAKGFRGTIGKVLPPVKLPTGQLQQNNHRIPAKHSSLNDHAPRPKKRVRTNWQSEESDSYGVIDSDDDDLESEDVDTTDAAPSVGTSGGRKMNGARSGAFSAARTSSMAARRSGEKTSPTCHLDKENEALITISLGKEHPDGGKVSERTSSHYFNQPTSLDGEPVDIPGYRSRSTTSEATWTGQQLFPLAPPNTSSDGIERSRRPNRLDQPPPQYQHEQDNQKQPLFVTGQGNKTSNLDSRRKSPPLHSLHFNRVSTAKLDGVPTHLANNNNNSSNSPSMISLSSISSMSSGQGDVYVGASVDAYDAAADLLQIHQSVPGLPLGPHEGNIISGQDALQVPSSDLESTDLAVAAGETTTGALSMNTASPPSTLSWYQQFLWDQHANNIVQDTPDTTATSDDALSDVDESGLPLTLQLEAIDSAGVVTVRNAHTAAGLASSSTLNSDGAEVLFSTSSLVGDDVSSNGVVPTMSVFGTGTSTPSLSLSSGSSSHSGSSSMTSSGSRMTTDKSGSYGRYNGHEGNGAGSFVTGVGSTGLHPDPRALKTTILESRTFMSTSSVVSTMANPERESPLQARLDRALRENRRLRAYIRERYGLLAEAEANVVMDMDYDY